MLTKNKTKKTLSVQKRQIEKKVKMTEADPVGSWRREVECRYEILKKKLKKLT